MREGGGPDATTHLAGPGPGGGQDERAGQREARVQQRERRESSEEGVVGAEGGVGAPGGTSSGTGGTRKRRQPSWREMLGSGLSASGRKKESKVAPSFEVKQGQAGEGGTRAGGSRPSSRSSVSSSSTIGEGGLHGGGGHRSGGGLGRAPAASAPEHSLEYSRWTMAFSDPVTQSQFKAGLDGVRAATYPVMGAVCVVLGLAVLIWAIVEPSDGGASALACGIFSIAGGACGLALAAQRGIVARWRSVASNTMYLFTTLVAMWAYLSYLRNSTRGEGTYYTIVIMGAVVLHLMLTASISMHILLPLVGALDVLLFLLLLFTFLTVGDIESGHGVDHSGSHPASVLCALLTSAIVAAMVFAREDETCRSFARLVAVQRVRDSAIRVQVRDEAERQKMDYVAQTLHDVGTPLATFALAIESLKASAPLNQEHLEALRTCDCAIELMTLTRRKAIDYARHHSGHELRPRLGSTNVRELVETKCRRIMSGFNSASMVPIAYNVDPGIAKYIVTDGEFVWECLVNYLSNAVKFTNEGSIQCNVYKIRPDRVRFEVRDTGIGIPHARKAQLFKPFSQLQKFAGGTGLGLWSVKKKVAALRGEVGVHDNPGGGSTFFFDIPYKPDFVLESAMEAQAVEAAEAAAAEAAAARAAVAAAAPGAAAGAAAPGGAGGGAGEEERCVLVVDHHASVRETAARLLGRHGFRLEYATNGFEGLTKMQQRAYTMVLIDFHVVVMDALQVLQKLRDWESSASGVRKRERASARNTAAAAAATLAANGGGGDAGAPREGREGSALRVAPAEPATAADGGARDVTGMDAAPADGAGDGATPSPPARQQRQFVCVMWSNNAADLPEMNAVINSGADAVWTDPVMPTARDILMMLEEAQTARAATAGGDGGTGDGTAAAASAPAPPAEAPPRSAGSVLLIEDELSILKFEKRMFELHGFEVDTATNGEEGLHKMKKRTYDAVFTDIVMPVMDGYETVRQFRQWEAEVAADADAPSAAAAAIATGGGVWGGGGGGGVPRRPRQVVYAVSANASEQDHLMAHAVGMDGFASKPVKVKELVELVRCKSNH